MVHSRRRRGRAASVPLASATLRREAYVEDIAAEQLAATLHVVWQCEVDFQWGCWADYSGEDARRLETAWLWMAPEVELTTNEAHGGNDRWEVCFVSMLQQNVHTGTCRRLRRILVTNA